MGLIERSELVGGVASQAASSLSNFLLVVAVARTSTATEFGGFAIAYSLSLVALGIARGLIGETLSVVGLAEHAVGDAKPRAPVASALFVGVLAGCCAVVAGLLLRGTPLGPPLLAFGVCLPLVLTQDAVRFVGFANHRVSLAIRSDLTWLALQVSSFAALMTFGSPSGSTFVFTWGLSAGLGAVIALPGELAKIRRADLAWLHTHMGLGRRLAAEFAVGSGASHLTLYLVGGTAGLAAAGALRAAESLYGPLNSVLTGLQSVLLPAAVREQETPSRSLIRLGLTIGGAFAVLAGAAALILNLIPHELGTALLGETWNSTIDVLLPLGVMYVATAVLRGMLLSLKASHEASIALLVRSITGLLVVLLGFTGVILGGVVGAASGMAFAQIAGVLIAIGLAAKATPSGQ